MSDADFDACLKNQALLDAVKHDARDAAAKLRVNSTPTFFVDGASSTASMRLTKIDEILAPAAK